MSITVSQLISDFRWTIDETGFPSTTEALRLLNRARQEVARKARCLDDVKSLSSSSATYRNALPSDMMEVRMVEWSDGENGIRRLFPLNKAEWDRVDYEVTHDNLSWYFIDNRYINFAPRLTSGATETAINIVGGITANDTTITVDSTADFPSVGRFICENEVIYYYGKTATTFTGCVRGAEGTTATTHADDKAVTERDIILYYYKYPTDLSSTSSNLEEVFEHYPNVLLYWMAWQTKLKDTDDVEGTGSNFQAQYFEGKWMNEMADFIMYLRGGQSDMPKTIQRVR